MVHKNLCKHGIAVNTSLRRATSTAGRWQGDVAPGGLAHLKARAGGHLG